MSVGKRWRCRSSMWCLCVVVITENYERSIVTGNPLCLDSWWIFSMIALPQFTNTCRPMNGRSTEIHSTFGPRYVRMLSAARLVLQSQNEKMDELSACRSDAKPCKRRSDRHLSEKKNKTQCAREAVYFRGQILRPPIFHYLVLHFWYPRNIFLSLLIRFALFRCGTARLHPMFWWPLKFSRERFQRAQSQDPKIFDESNYGKKRARPPPRPPAQHNQQISASSACG